MPRHSSRVGGTRSTGELWEDHTTHLDVESSEDSIHFPPHHRTRAGVPGDGAIGLTLADLGART